MATENYFANLVLGQAVVSPFFHRTPHSSSMNIVLRELTWTLDFVLNHQFLGVAPHRIETAPVALSSFIGLNLGVVIPEQFSFESQSPWMLGILEEGTATGASS